MPGLYLSPDIPRICLTSISSSSIHQGNQYVLSLLIPSPSIALLLYQLAIRPLGASFIIEHAHLLPRPSTEQQVVSSPTSCMLKLINASSAVTRSHKHNDRDHAALADGTAEHEDHLPRYFAKSGHADADPNKTKKNGGGKGNWYVLCIHRLCSSNTASIQQPPRRQRQPPTSPHLSLDSTTNSHFSSSQGP